MEQINEVLEFITANQHLLIVWSLLLAYGLHRLITYMADKPKEDFWDDVRPYSDALYKLVHEGIEAYTKSNPMSSEAKAQTFLLKLQEFEKAWAKDKIKAIKELAAWYLSMKEKKMEAITAESVAVD